MNQDDWYKSWQIHLEQYLKAPPRTGMFIHSFFPSIRNSLEIACGSSRDSIYLAKKDIDATASDYESRVINDLQKRFSFPHLKYQQANAFHLTFDDATFDMVFHNGFFVCFHNDKDIHAMLREQARVSRKHIVFFVHNKLNTSLVKRFAELAPTDPIYDIHFFDPDEIDLFFSKKIKRIIPNVLYPFREKVIPRLYQRQPWEKTERIACHIELKK
jgi:ubiquinone/menaquinone biosynthesis C-methylase UbiE